jgi:hypothetical protein
LVFTKISEAVVAGVRAAAVRIQRPLERHSLDAVERGAAADFLISSCVSAPLCLGQGGGASLLDHARDVARREQPRPEIEQHAALFRFCFAKSS